MSHNQAFFEPEAIVMSHNQAFFEPEAITVMTTAFEETLRTLGLVDHTGLATEIVAKKIIELAQQGERDPIRLRDRAVQSLSV